MYLLTLLFRKLENEESRSDYRFVYIGPKVFIIILKIISAKYKKNTKNVNGT